MIALLIALAAQAATPSVGLEGAGAAPTKAWPTHEQDVVLRNFRFRDGESLPELRMHVTTLGSPHRNAAGQIDNAVMVLHGTGGDGKQFLRPQFADELYGPGQPLDIHRYWIILPDNIGHGKSSKPSDGMHMGFPKYDYDDMVEAQHRMLAEGLGVTHLRLIFGTSMGCMHAFVWGETYPDFASALMPMACEPVEIAGLNRMWRQLAIDGIEKDPAWRNGNYASEPVAGPEGGAESCCSSPARRRSITRRSIRRARPRALMPRSGSRPVWQKWTPTTRSISWMPRGTTTRGRSWSGSRRR